MVSMGKKFLLSRLVDTQFLSAMTEETQSAEDHHMWAKAQDIVSGP